MDSKKKLLIAFILILIFVLSCFGINSYNSYYTNIINTKNYNNLVKDIESHFNDYVITNKVANLYTLENDEYKEIGTIGESVTLELITENIKKDSKYFQTKDFDGKYYIYYKDVDKTDNLQEEVNTRYKSYIPFNQNIITKEKISFYKENELIYEFNESLSIPIIIKDTNGYYVEFNNQLLYVKKDDIEKIIESNNTSKESINQMAVITFHSIYDDGKQSTCTSSICHSYTELESYFKYIKNNNFFTPTMNELEQFIDGNIRLPKSVMVTVDDGWMMENAITLMEKYEVNGTIFLITAWYNVPKEDYQYVEFHSHGNDLHNTGVCPGGQGGGIKCLPKETILKDLKTSRERLNGSIAFCYPFYEYNSYSINLVKEAGFHLAFIGGRQKIKVGDNKMTLKRYTIVNTMSVNDLANTIN